MLFSGNETEVLSRGGILSQDQPWWVLAEVLGPKATRALLKIVLELNPAYVVNTQPVWAEVPGYSLVTIWVGDLKYQLPAAEVAERFRGVVATAADGKWVR